MWILVVLATLSGVAWWGCFERARLRGAWLDQMHGARNGTFDIGLSVLVADAQEMPCYEALLSVEYARFEVVAVVDGVRDAALLAALQEHYHLIQVLYRPSGELPVYGVHGLYRSRKRRFRRLVVVDCRVPQRAVRLNAAADVAAYDYLMPIRRDEELATGAVERLVTELALHPLERIDRLCLAPVLRVLLWRRTALSRAGGFAAPSVGVGTAERRVWVWLSPFRTAKSAGGGAWLAMIGVGMPVALLGALLSRSWQFPLAALLALLLWALLLLRYRQLSRLKSSAWSRMEQNSPETEKLKIR